jgi:hypothetical protein
MPVRAKSKFISLPSDFDPIDATLIEVQSWRRESPWTVHQKIRDGRYESYLDGRIRTIIFASVKRDRERTMKEGLTRKRSPGRPRKIPKPEPATVAP